MLRHANDILGQILVIAFFAIMVTTPLIILTLGIVNLLRDTSKRGKSILQAVGALAIWVCISFAMVMVFFMTVFSYPGTGSPSNEMKANGIYIGGTFFYFIVSGALIYWTKSQTKRMPPMGLSC
ncbi:MAG: hypothetical protein QOH71_1881 [Blastocatellia bacterium]|nr:hypothetical protein [Blastocatellia bacterium]